MYLFTAILIVLMVFIIHYVSGLNRRLIASGKVIQQERDKLEESERKLRSIIEDAAEGILLSDEQGAIIEWNKQLEAISGFTHSSVIGRFIWDVQFDMIPEQQSQAVYEKFKSALQEILQTGASHFINQPIDREIQQPDGTRRNVRNIVSPIATGKGFMIAGFISDITERKQSEQQILETRDYLENIIKSSWDAIVISDNAGHITKCNRAFLKLTGYAENEIIGKGVYEFSPTEEGTYPSTTGKNMSIDGTFFGDARSAIETFMEKGMISGWQTYIISRDNILIPVEENIVFLFNEHGERIGAVGTIRDITERKCIDEEREQLIAELQKALSEVKTLGGLLPICASCKKIRDDQGYWQQIEGYIREHTEAEFSHSICPECAKKLYPDLYEEQK